MKRKRIRTGVILLAWLVLWQMASVLIGNRIIFVGPADVCMALARQLPTAEFWRTLLNSSLRIGCGFLLAFAGGILLGAIAFRFRLLEEFLEPAMGLLQSVPVASFVILALIWIGSKNLSILICFVVVFPVIYRNTIQGMRAANRGMLEMARVFHMTAGNRLLYIYRPALLPYLQSACHVVLGMAWKSGVAAEVIGVPDLSVGEKLYMAKIYLSTGDLFAWTLVIIMVSRVFQWGFLNLLSLAEGARTEERRSGKGKQQEILRRKTGRWSGKESRENGNMAADLKNGRPEEILIQESAEGVTAVPDQAVDDTGTQQEALVRETKVTEENHMRQAAAEDTGKEQGNAQLSEASVVLHNVSKSFRDNQVLTNFSMELRSGGVYCLMGPSGIGKTTLLRILMGLEQPDDSDALVKVPERISAVFQEERLCEYADAPRNIHMVSRREGLLFAPEEVLGALLDAEAHDRPVGKLSGGMRRRVSIARALAVDSQLILMDEPFTGLDAATRENTIQAVKKYRAGRTLLVVTHREEDARELGAEIMSAKLTRNSHQDLQEQVLNCNSNFTVVK